MMARMGLLSRLFGGGKPPAPWNPSGVAHVAFDGAIRVIETPRGEGWRHFEESREGEGFTVMVLKYILPAQPAPLALLAKIYTNGEGWEPPKDPATTDWREIFRPLLSEISGLTTLATRQLTMAAALPAWEAALDGVGAESGVPLRIRERRAVLGRELFIVTAMGSPALFEAHAANIDRWFDTAAFVPISDAPAR
jgi:hypothetical protein